MKDIQEKLKKMPEGKLICSHTGPYCKWERSDGHKKTYIPKKDRALAEKLAAKKYLSALWNDLKHEKDAIDLYLRRHSNYEPQVDKLLTDSIEVEKLLSPYLSPLSKELEEWMNSPYEHNLKHPEQCGFLIVTAPFIYVKLSKRKSVLIVTKSLSLQATDKYSVQRNVVIRQGRIK